MNLLKKTYLLIPALLLCSASCRKENRFDCLKRRGEEVSVQRQLSAFHALHIEDDVYVYLRYDSLYRVRITAGNGLLDLVETRVSDSVLYLSNANTCNWMRSYRHKISIEVFAPMLKDIWFGGTGDVIAADTLCSDSLSVNLWGAGGRIFLNLSVNKCRLNIHTTTGDIYARGSCGLGYYYSAGNGFIFASDLKTELIYLLNKGTGDMYIHPLTTLEAELSAAGDVYYRGNPVNIKVNISGTGRLIHL